MSTSSTFPQAQWLERLQHLRADPSLPREADVPADIRMAASADMDGLLDALIEVLSAREVVWQAVAETARVADELRKYQKFVKPGRPSAFIVQLRQQQASARQSSSLARQRFIRAGMAFLRVGALELPGKVTLEDFLPSWLDAHEPFVPEVG